MQKAIRYITREFSGRSVSLKKTALAMKDSVITPKGLSHSIRSGRKNHHGSLMLADLISEQMILPERYSLDIFLHGLIIMNRNIILGLFVKPSV